MKQNKNVKVTVRFFNPFRIVWLLVSVFTAMVGYQIHDNLFYAFINFIFWPISWIYWLICHDVNISIIRETFSFFLK